MYKCVLRAIGAAFLMTVSINLALAEDSRLQIHNNDYTFTELRQEGLISKDGHTALSALGVAPGERVSVRISRDLGVAEARIQAGDDLAALSSADYPEDGAEREHRWEREEDGDTFKYTRIERYFEANGSSGWREVHYSRTYVGPAPGDGDIPTDPE